jgi:hypothetical protein
VVSIFLGKAETSQAPMLPQPPIGANASNMLNLLALRFAAIGLDNGGL